MHIDHVAAILVGTATGIVDEARRIEFRLVAGTSFVALRKAATRTEDPAGARRVKKAAPTKPAALKGQTAKVRRAEARKTTKQESARPAGTKRAAKGASVKKSARKSR